LPPGWWWPEEEPAVGVVSQRFPGAVITQATGTSASVVVSHSPPQAPEATTGPAENITSTGATLNGIVNPLGQATTYHFAYGKTPSYGLTSVTATAGSGTSPELVASTLKGLSSDTTYYFELVATNSSGTTKGAQLEFTTTVTPTTTTLGASTSTPSLGQAVTYTATVSPSQTGTGLGTVAFSKTGKALTCGTGSHAFNGTTATCVVSYPEAGVYTVGANYSGDNTYGRSSSRVLAVLVAVPNPGYRVSASTGGVFSFGTAAFHGSLGAEPLANPITSITADPYSGGYWLLATEGAVIGFAAPSDGTAAGLVISDRAMAIVAG